MKTIEISRFPQRHESDRNAWIFQRRVSGSQPLPRTGAGRAPPKKHSRRSSIRPKPPTRSTNVVQTQTQKTRSMPTLQRLADWFCSLSPRHSLRSRSPALISPVSIIVEGSNDIALLKGLSTLRSSARVRSPNLLAWDDRANIVHS